MSDGFKRKKLFIDAAVQGALLRRLLIHWFCFACGALSTVVILQIMLQGVEHPMSYHLAQVWQKYGVLGLPPKPIGQCPQTRCLVCARFIPILSISGTHLSVRWLAGIG